MKLRWFIPIVVLLPLPLRGSEPVPPARIATIVINPSEVTPLHLRPQFDSVIRMPEEITSVVLGSPESFKAEHNEGEPRYVYVKPITRDPAISNLMIATKSGTHVTLELISDGAAGGSSAQAIDFLIEYRASRGFMVTSAPPVLSSEPAAHSAKSGALANSTSENTSALDEEYAQQMRINAPSWTHWEGMQIETSIGEIRQWNNQVAVSYSVLNPSNRPVEIVPPQIQITGRKLTKKKKEGKGVTSDQLQIREYRLSKTRLEPGERADGVAVYDRPNFKQSTEKLFLQLAQADQVDRPILIRLPFTPAIANNSH
ncbi:MAG: hypothetical protein QOJ51_5659 [Acidobacteriaceae bacterium]|nr:hypothetical protein [Acidobacteriaceae bacterium]